MVGATGYVRHDAQPYSMAPESIGLGGAILPTVREVDVDGLLKRLHLANARRVWRDLIRHAEVEQWSSRDFLTVLVAEGGGALSFPRVFPLALRVVAAG